MSSIQGQISSSSLRNGRRFCLVDTDILFRDGWVKALKEFLKPYDPKEPVVAAFPEWTADGSYDFNDETTIYQHIEWG
ncbi:MAG: hypothetical protein ACK4I8_05855, partial [Armatimonadota bacterium]